MTFGKRMKNGIDILSSSDIILKALGQKLKSPKFQLEQVLSS
jgi:hypothetical protein